MKMLQKPNWLLGVCLVLSLVTFVGMVINAEFAIVKEGPRIEVGDNFTGDIVVPAATGIEGYTETAAFCNDPLTMVSFTVVPEVGLSYEMLRTRASVTELITASVHFDGTVSPGSHWYDTAVGPQKEPAVINDAALECMEKKGKLKQ